MKATALGRGRAPTRSWPCTLVPSPGRRLEKTTALWWWMRDDWDPVVDKIASWSAIMGGTSSAGAMFRASKKEDGSKQVIV